MDMNKLFSAATATAFAGLLIVIPMAILLLVGLEIYFLLEDTAAFARLELPFPAFINALIYIAMLVIVSFFICLLVGLSLKTGLGQKFAQFFERSVADRIPLLSLIRNLTMNIAGKGTTQFTAVEADLAGNGTSVLAMLMETLPDGRQVIFVPGAPAVTLGTIYLVPAERVTHLSASSAALAGVVSQWGAGASDIVAPKS
jgi:uncharacterized membrane protein